MPDTQGVHWRVASVVRESPEAVRVRIHPPSPESMPGSMEWAGAYVSFELPTLTPLNRSYSVIRHEVGMFLEFIVKNVRGGKASRFFHTELEPGMTLRMTHWGNDLWRTEWNEKPTSFIGFAGGIGIAPVVSCMNKALQLERNHRFTLYHSCSSERRQIAKEEVKALNRRAGCGSYEVFTDSNFSGANGANRITRDQVKRWLAGRPDRLEAVYLICGPHGMMEEVHRGLDALGVPMEQRFTEHFTNRPLSHESAVTQTGAHSAERPQCTVEIEQDSGVQSFVMHGDGQSILKAATAAGINLPSRCSGGICMACQAKIVEGSVQRHGISGLTEEEKAKGMTLCCRSLPESNRLRLRLVNA